MANIFNSVRERLVGSSRFNLSHEVKTTFNMAELVPFLCQEVVPGDKWQLQSEVFLRFNPMLAPIMHRVNCYVHYFFVPTRLLFADYEAFFDPKRTNDVILPQIFVPTAYLNEYSFLEGEGSQYYDRIHESLRLLDFMGIPVRYENDDALNNPELNISALPFYAYQLIYNEYYRDQNLEDDLLEEYPHGLPSGYSYDLTDSYQDDTIGNILRLRNRAWEKDYFTSALPDPQVGEEVHLPLQGNAPVKASGQKVTNFDFEHTAGAVYQQSPVFDDATKTLNILPASGSPGGPHPLNMSNASDGSTNLYADMSQVSATTINELRRASRLQEFLERTARGGRRYKEMIASHFGVFSKDARLDRPEFLGGGVQPVTISEVLNHTGTDTSQASSFVLGQMGGHGISVGASAQTRRRFTEHGYLFGIISVMPRTAYMDGLPRMFSKLDMYDYYWPEFARIGEQEIENREVSVWDELHPTAPFGYAPRYSEYKYIPSSVHGEMRGSLDYWHLARKFGADVALNAEFVHPKPEDLNRIFAVQSGADQLIGQIYNKTVAIRKMPKYGIPTL